MKRALLLLCCALALPAVTYAGVSVDINVPGVSLHLGDRDDRGNYWDGYDWRPPQWWKEHHNQRVGERNDRGMYWNGGGWQQHAPGHKKPHNNNKQGGKSSSPQGNNNHQNNGKGQPLPPQTDNKHGH